MHDYEFPNKTVPKVSVVMSVFNSEKFVERAIGSVLRQTYQNFEFIIINDASEDHTQNILEKFQKTDGRIKLIINKENLGLTKSLNIGLKSSKFPLIARIDADDWWESDKLEQQLNFLTASPDYGIIGTWVVCHDFSSSKIEHKTMPVSSTEIEKRLLDSSPFAHSSIIFKKDIAKRYDESFETSQDYELYSRILEKTKGYNLPKFLTHRSTHYSANISVEKWRLQKRNKLRIKVKLLKKYKVPFWRYFELFPDLAALVLLPASTKLWVSKLRRILG